MVRLLYKIKVNKKNILSIVFGIIAIVIIGVRIYYLNYIKYTFVKIQEYNIGDIVKIEDTEFTINDIYHYSGEELYESDMWNGDKYGADSDNIIVQIKIKNISEDVIVFEPSDYVLFKKGENTTGINPEAYDALNLGYDKVFELKPGDYKHIYLPYPINSNTIDGELVLSLYPSYVYIRIKK